MLLLLAPWIAEVLFGATPASNIGGLLVVGPLYGCGALLVRELARRQGTGWGRIALLGAAYGIIEEGLAIGSLSNANLFNSGLLGGRLWGINWVWSEWTIGYHIVWSMTIPILLTELLFPARRREPWLERGGLIVVGVIYLLAATALGAIFRFAVTSDYRAPSSVIVGEVLIVAVLVTLALRWPPRRPAALMAGTAPKPWLVGLVALVLAVAWFALLDLPHLLRVGALVLLPMGLDLLLAGGVATLLRRWSAAGSLWRDRHRLALILGALPVSIAWGFLFVTAGNRIDQLFLGGAGLITLLLLVFFAWRLGHRDPAAHYPDYDQAPVA
ncbi:MAG: hypothetical protein R2867_11070 [Caldilineaceae bacterium]